MVSLDLIKQYLRIDEDYEDELLEMLKTNAIHYIEDSVDNMNWENEKALDKATLLILVLVSDWYENREYMHEGKISQGVRYTVHSLLLQLQGICLGDTGDTDEI